MTKISENVAERTQVFVHWQTVTIEIFIRPSDFILLKQVIASEKAERNLTEIV